MFTFGFVGVFAIWILSGVQVPCNGQPAPGTINSDARVCKRWAHSSALSSNTLYVYGGNARRQQSELGTRNLTINRDFISLDLSNDFELTDAPFVGLPIPPIPGPAKVLQGAFWVDDAEPKITLYGGSFNPNPQDRTDVVEDFSLWSYSPAISEWKEEETRGDPVLRASRGASTYYKGVGYYRGGQLDNLTVPDWPDGDRGVVILSGMLKVDLATSSIINETEASGHDVFQFQNPQNTGLQYRDGTLIPVTFNKRDYLINFAGGGPRGHALPLGSVYVYDIERATWYRQPVSGDAPENTRAACAVANYAPDKSSVQIIVYGGLIYNQALEDFEATSDMWILTIPGFQWIPVAPGSAFRGPGTRQDHTCHLVGSQMLVVAGRNNSNICEGSGIWVFDTAKLEWQTSFVANSLYTVPTLVSNTIGGDSNGGISWDNLPVIPPPDINSPFYNMTSGSTSASKTLSGGAIAGIVIGALALLGIGPAGWYLYKRYFRRDLEEAPLPPPIDDHESDPTKVTYGGSPNEIPELGSPTPSSHAPRYSTLSGYEPAQLHGDSSLPVELYSPPLELPSEPIGVYEVQGEKTLGENASSMGEQNQAPGSQLQEPPILPPAGRSQDS
ncbi:hypothetical protein TWF730_008921 [Orbilia blumenaviensis]|uniref:Kelch repeat-containing protein n=1 Tax=Orbilia blumenaviensis TaxID=1796055 RepID=A0AAV9UZ76_9PEZI